MARPHDLKAFRRGAEWALVAATAHELQVFETLAAGPATGPELAERLSLDPRGAEILLTALEELDLARREDGENFALTGQARARFVDRDAPDFEASAMALWHVHIRDWATGLGTAIRRGAAPEEAADDGGEDPESRRRFLAAMAAKDPEMVRRTVDACLARLGQHPPPEPRILDLGGGPGTFARAFAERGASTVLMDRPEVVELAVEEYGLAEVEGLELVTGDFLRELPAGPFDIVFLANITHIYDPPTNAELLRRLAGTVRPGGAVAILDFVRGLAEFAALFAITMLLNTERGNTYSREAYEVWLRAAGFESVRFQALDADRHLVTALRPGSDTESERG